MYSRKTESWSKDLGTDEIQFHEFSAYFHNDGDQVDVEYWRKATFAIQVENVLDSMLIKISINYAKNALVVSVKEEWKDGCLEPVEQLQVWKFANHGDEAGRAGRIARWFMSRLDNVKKADRIITNFPDMARALLTERPNLLVMNCLFNGVDIQEVK